MGTDWMSNMKIGGKLFLSYFLLIGAIFFVTSISFRFISQNFLIQETKSQLQKEAKIISRLLSKEALSNENIQSKLENRRAFVISEKLLSSKMLILNKNKELIYTDLKPVLLRQYQKQSKQFVSVTVPIYSASGSAKGYVSLVERLDDLKKFNTVMRHSQLISLVISAILALFLGLIFQRNLTKPIRMLASAMRNFSIKGDNKDVVITTNDEIRELADSFNMMSARIKQYDENQKSFFQNASHELKTPLMAIQGNAELILDKIVTGEDAEHSLYVIISESQRLKKIVEGITYLAQLENIGESFQFNRAPLDRVLQEAVKSVGAIAEQREITIQMENSHTESLLMDEEKLTRAFINLLGNALRYAETRIEVVCHKSNDSIIIEVKDDGTGFSPGEETKVFERFYSGDSGGTGIGLAITKVIIEGHNGTITALPNEPKGAIFRVQLGTKLRVL
jgi:signal transduction histidine kinase